MNLLYVFYHYRHRAYLRKSRERERGQRHLEDSRAERERSRLDMTSRMDMTRAVCERGENSRGWGIEKRVRGAESRENIIGAAGL